MLIRHRVNCRPNAVRSLAARSRRRLPGAERLLAKSDLCTMVRVTTVRTRRDFSEYIEVPYCIYRASPYWVPPLKISIRRQLSFARQSGGEITPEHFLAHDSAGRCVGRIAAAFHKPYVERYGPIGFFGFFECEENAAAATALLGAAEEWARQHGMKELAGPYSYTTSQDVGMLIEGYDKPPSFLQPYHPRYYREFIEQAGYRQKFTTSAFYINRTENGKFSTFLASRAEKVRSKISLTVRFPDSNRYESDMELIRGLLNRSFANHPDSIPVSHGLFRFIASDLRRLIRPDLVQIIERNGSAVAFLVMFPDIGAVLCRCRGSLFRYILSQREVRRIRSLIVVMMGAAPEAAGLGIGRCISGRIADMVIQGNFEEVYTTRVHEDNGLCRALLTSIGAAEHKRYAVFTKEL